MNEMEAFEPIEPGEPVQATVYIDGILKRLGIDPDDIDNRIAVSWPIIFPEYASISRCGGIRDGKLIVRVSHPSRLSLLKLNTREIMKKIRAFAPDSGIEGLIFTLDQKKG